MFSCYLPLGYYVNKKTGNPSGDKSCTTLAIFHGNDVLWVYISGSGEGSFHCMQQVYTYVFQGVRKIKIDGK